MVPLPGLKEDKQGRNYFKYGVFFLFVFWFFSPTVSSRRKEVKAKCSLTCEYLTEEDYTDLLWTTLSEFPGKWW